MEDIPSSAAVPFSTPATVPSEPRQLDCVAKSSSSLVVRPDSCFESESLR